MKELKEQYRKELEKAWSDKSMIDFLLKQADIIIEHDGKLYEIKKPSIEKDFCFGYGYSGFSTQKEMQDAFSAAAHARTSENYFLEKNIEPLNRTINELKDILNDMSLNWADGNYPRYMIEIRPHYNRQPEDCKLYSYSFVRSWDSRSKNFADKELINKLIAGYEEAKSNFEKRLKTYLKRYGTSKLNVWTYLSD